MAPDHPPLLVEIAFFHLVGVDVAVQHLSDILEVRVEIVRVGELLEGHCRQFRGGISQHGAQRLIHLEKRTVRQNEGHPDGRELEGARESFLAGPQLFLGPFALRGVFQDEVGYGPAVEALSQNADERSPQFRSVRFYQPQVAGQRRAGSKELPAAQIENVLVVGKDESGKRLPIQSVLRRPEQRCGGIVGLQNLPLVGDDEIADRGQVEKGEVLRPLGIELFLDLKKLLVLHFQFDLMNP